MRKRACAFCYLLTDWLCYCHLATFKNQLTNVVCLTYTTRTNEPQDLRGYWTKVHEFFTRRREIIVDINAAFGVAIFPSVVECQRTDWRRSVSTCRSPWQHLLTENHQILSRSNFSSTVLTQQCALRSVTRCRMTGATFKKKKKVTSAKHKPAAGIAGRANY